MKSTRASCRRAGEPHAVRPVLRAVVGGDRGSARGPGCGGAGRGGGVGPAAVRAEPASARSSGESSSWPRGGTVGVQNAAYASAAALSGRLDVRGAVATELLGRNRLLPRRFDDDVLARDLGGVVAWAAPRVRRAAPAAQEDVVLARKGWRGLRPLSVLSLTDRIAYRALVGLLAESLPDRCGRARRTPGSGRPLWRWRARATSCRRTLRRSWMCHHTAPFEIVGLEKVVCGGGNVDT